MTGPARGRWSWAAATAFIGMALATAPGFPPGAQLWPLVNICAITPAAIAGALLLVRRPDNPIGALLLGAAGLMSGTDVLGWYALAGAAMPTPWPGAAAAAVGASVLFDAATITALVLVPLVFPSGRLISARWRVVVWFVPIVLMLDFAGTALEDGPLRVNGLDNPFGKAGLDPLADVLLAMAVTLASICLVAAVGALWTRFRDGSRTTRQQLKWLVAVAGLGAMTVPLSAIAPSPILADLLAAFGLLMFGAVPIAIGIAVLRYRLYDIDRLISRSIGWAIVTATLVGAFALLVLGLQAVLEPLTGGNTLAIAASTLVVAALFQPLRSRVQAAVDRRFDRSRYDGERLLAAFGERLRDEVDLTTIRADMLSTVDAAVRPARVGLWLRHGPEESGA